MKHFQLDFEEKRVPLFMETTDDELSEYNSDYKVPILIDGDLVVWDSLSILEYLSEQHLNNRGWPADAQARSVARSVSAEMHSSFSNLRNEFPMNCRKKITHVKPSAEAQHEIERIKWLWRRCRDNYGNGGEWLFGEFSIADAMFAPIALRFSGYNTPLTGIEEGYVNSVLNHPGIVEWVAAGKAETEIIEADEI
jgi:glutathione S-transferase